MMDDKKKKEMKKKALQKLREHISSKDYTSDVMKKYVLGNKKGSVGVLEITLESKEDNKG